MSSLKVRLSESKLRDYPYLSKVEDIVNVLPHGSGFDGDWVIDLEPSNYPNAFCFSNSYHAMDGNGFYSGWLNFTIFVGNPEAYGNVSDMEDFETFNPSRWYYNFEIDYDPSDLDYDDGDDLEIDENDHPDDYFENTAVDLDSLIQYIDDTICDALQGIVDIIIEEE